MARTKGSKNKNQPRIPHTVLLTTEQKVEFLALLIIEQIDEDLLDKQRLLKRIEANHVPRTPAA